jgi:hypothetical protein
MAKHYMHVTVGYLRRMLLSPESAEMALDCIEPRPKSVKDALDVLEPLKNSGLIPCGHPDCRQKHAGD